MALQNSSQLWTLNGSTALLQSPLLSASINLLEPNQGLNELTYDGATLAGSVLGLALGSESQSNIELEDVFVRGGDLVVTFAATPQRPFSLQVYWRASVQESLVLIDTILSLQTDLLESFPGVAIETTMPTEKIAVVTNQAATELSVGVERSSHLAANDSDCLLFALAGGNSSYAEMTHPEDRGGVAISHKKSGSYNVRRQLGGGFLEKGVIRRLRVRGVFLPQKEDAQHAAECFASLATQQPPLTV